MRGISLACLCVGLVTPTVATAQESGAAAVTNVAIDTSELAKGALLQRGGTRGRPRGQGGGQGDGRTGEGAGPFGKPGNRSAAPPAAQQATFKCRVTGFQYAAGDDILSEKLEEKNGEKVYDYISVDQDANYVAALSADSEIYSVYNLRVRDKAYKGYDFMSGPDHLLNLNRGTGKFFRMPTVHAGRVNYNTDKIIPHPVVIAAGDKRITVLIGICESREEEFKKLPTVEPKSF